MSDDARKQQMTRRTSLRLLAGAGAAGLVGCTNDLSRAIQPAAKGDPAVTIDSLSCVARPQLTAGPFFVDDRLDRSDIRSDPSTGAVAPGVPLKLAFNVSRIENGVCTPLPGAVVDIWHTDALGRYSDIRSEGTSGQQFLRGYQTTDKDGVARFTTIYPGWYRGRTIHVHFKIRTFANDREVYDFTSQLFFDDATTDRVVQEAPYRQRGEPDTTNRTDWLYRNGGNGSKLLLSLSGDGDGYAAAFAIGLEGVPAAPARG